MHTWSPPQRPAEYAESSLIQAILDGNYPPGAALPAERSLAARLGVTRPTLREALQRLERDGWLTIQQGKSTQVNDFWSAGGLNVLNALVRHSKGLPADFIPNLLTVRLDLAPAYTRLAVTTAPQQVRACLADAPGSLPTPQEMAGFDWQLHHTLTKLSGNPIYTLILNGFSGFYQPMAVLYFQHPPAIQASLRFYAALTAAVEAGDAPAAGEVTRQAMQESLQIWETYIRR